MFYEIQPGSKIKLSEVIAYSYSPKAESEWRRKILHIDLKGARENYTYNFDSADACDRAYKKLDAALTAMSASSNIKTIMD